MEELILTVTEIVAANRLYNTPTEQPIHRHNRRLWAVALKRTGRTIYTANGRQVLSDSRHMVILPKGCSYSWRCTEAGECLIVEFDAPQVCEDILPFPVADSAFFENAFLELQKNLHTPTSHAQLGCMHRFYGVLSQLVKSTSGPYVPKARQQLIQPALDHMAENYFDPTITNDRLARLCGISTVYFRKCFEAVCGVSPIRYLHDLRLQKAKDILSSDYGSVGLVAQSVGYSSVYHFSKMFKFYTGISPSQYAKGNRKPQ